MGYELGVDLGTTYTAAARHRGGSVQIIELGNRAASIPSVVFLTPEDQILTGDAANRRAVTEPGRVAREFKRRIGDPTPILLGGSPYSAESLSARLLEWVIEKVAEQEGEQPDRIAVTHPANWGPYKLDLLHQAFRLADLEHVVTITEPEAAAIHYSTLERIEPGMTVGVFDLGGGTFDAAVLRKKAQGFDFLGEPEGIERLGGIDFDAAVFGFVRQALGDAIDQLQPDDPAAIGAVSRLRRDCVEAKEALSGDTETTIPVVLPGVHTDLRLTRSELEQMLRPSLADTIGAMQRAIRSADLQLDEIDVILLVGGSSRIPLVGQMVRAELGRPVAVDAHPKHSVALGAAWAAAQSGVAHLASATIVASGDALAAGAGAAVAGAVGATGGGASAPTGQPVAAQPAAAQPVTGQPAAAQPAAAQPAAQAGGATQAAPVTGQPAAQAGGAPQAAHAAPGIPGPEAQPMGRPPSTGQPSTGQPVTGQPVQPGDATQAAPVTGQPGDASQAAPGTGPEPHGFAAGAALGAAGAAGSVSGGPAGTGEAAAGGSGFGSGGNAPLGSKARSQGGGTGGSRTPLLIGLGVLVALLVIGGVAAAQLGGDDGGEVAGLAESEVTDEGDDGTGDDGETGTTEAETTTTTEAETTTTEESTTTTEPPFECSGLCTHVDEVTVQDNGELLIYWEPFNFTGVPDTGNFHAHFFYDIYEPEQAGANASALGFERGDWQLTDDIPFDTTGTNVSVANAPAGATQICVVAADSGHGVVNPENAECFDLP